KITCEGNNAYIANSTLMKLQIINFSTPSAPILASELNTSSALNVSILNNIVSVSSNTYGLKFVDVSNPITPVLLSTYKSTDYQPSTYSSAMKSGVTFVATSTYGLYAINTTNLASPVKISSLLQKNRASQLAVNEANTVAVAAGSANGTDIIDISNIGKPSIVSSITGISSDAVISGNTLYLAVMGDIKIYNLSNPALPSLLSTITTPGSTSGVAISGASLLIADGASGFEVADVSNPSSPLLKPALNLGGGSATKIATQGNYAYVVNSSLTKLQIVNFDNISAPTLVSEVNTTLASNVAVQGNIVALSARNYGVKFIDVSVPASPTILSSYVPPSGYQAYPYSCAFKDNMVFVAIPNYGINVVDISNPSSPTSISTIKTVGARSDASASIDVVANGNYVFFADDRAELTTLDIYHDTPTVVKTADKYIVHSGDEVTYTLTVSNTSPNALTSLNLSDVISAGTTYVTGSATGGGSYNSVDKKVTWTIPSLPASGQAGATMTVTFRVTID
ncbi:MAG: isopeptide-forming domain-containing fimbrial protein, partial [Patescibacteria group bacterium]